MSRFFILYVSILALASAPLFISGCTSSSEQGETETASTDDGLDSGELADDGGTSTESTADVDAPADAAPTDAAPAPDTAGDDIVADLGDDPTAEKPMDLPDEPMGTEAAPADQGIADNSDPANVPPPAEGLETADASPAPLVEDTPPPAPVASLKKIKDAPFNSNGRILNTVYVARKGDNLNKVSEKLYGDKKHKKDLQADNSFLNRGVKEGDKIYYNSPRRPDDTTTMMTYYEDNGIPAQTYVTQDGDDLKKLAKDLLGSKEAWKELWVTNANIESKNALDAGTEVRYWASAGETVVATNTPPPSVPSEMPPPPNVAGTMTPPAQDANAFPPPSDSLPPPPPIQDTAALPPPPPAMEQNMADIPAPPPPPPPMGAKKPAQTPESFLFQDQETTMAFGAGGILLLSVLLIVVHRIKKGRAQKMRLGQTQV